ncbi:endoplasmic oxidoreductin-1 [Basidiobolus ranarum]|uniref:Endoplasmic oxidoreductin-1 n=1 Tax=Basidiobolus ranarum TaxID=34480 RepID=A0ABR2WSI0_9FUNG
MARAKKASKAEKEEVPESTTIRIIRFIIPIAIAAISLTIWFPTILENNNNAVHENSTKQAIQPFIKVPTGQIGDAHSEYDTLNQVNEDLSSHLRTLIRTPFFSHYKLNLYKQCPFWDVGGLCVQRDCAVEILDENQVPEELRNKLGAIDFTPATFGFQPIKKCEYSDKDFCLVEAENSEDGVYVNLVNNPERFTGYSGDSANRIWQSIYEENCFKSDSKHDHISHMDNALTSPEDQDSCLEKRVFYRLVSGLHASISIHVCDEFYNKTTGEWGHNMPCYHYRVGKFPERIENVYFNYAIVLRAINKMSKYLTTYDFCSGNKQADDEVKNLVNNVVSATSAYPPTFNEKAFFSDPRSHVLKEEFRDHFRNVSRIMDCVGCEKCRLWGKIQTTGLGTALKVLFSYDDHKFGGKSNSNLLQRSEIVALFNTFNRFSESVEAIQRFQAMYPDYPQLQ